MQKIGFEKGDFVRVKEDPRSYEMFSGLLFRVLSVVVDGEKVTANCEGWPPYTDGYIFPIPVEDLEREESHDFQEG